MTSKKNGTLKLLSASLEELKETLHLTPEPVKNRKVGDVVYYGKFGESTIQSVEENGKILLIEINSTKEKEQKYINWMDVFDSLPSETNFVENKDLQLHYSQKTIGDLIQKAYHFGVDFEPEYQREYVWDQQDKIILVDSIFKNVDIGKFVFIELTEKEAKENGYKISYEVLDGKQRTRAILDFLEGRFAYRGKYYGELSNEDRIHFKRYSINMATLSGLSEEQKLRYFLKLNTSGKQIDEKHLAKIQNKLDNIQTK